MSRNWTTPEGLAFEGVQTGDGRIFTPGAFSWADGPWSLRYDQEDDGGHSGAVMVGDITELARAEPAKGSDVVPITGAGTLDNETEMGADVERLLDNEAPLGVSVDLDDVEVEFVMDAADMEDEGGVVLLAASFAQASVMSTARPITAGSTETRPAVKVWAPGLGTLYRSLMEDLGAGEALTAAAGEGDIPSEDEVVLFTDASDEVLLRFTRARIRGATLVDIPAFDRAAIKLDPLTDDNGDPIAPAGDSGDLAGFLAEARTDAAEHFAVAAAAVVAAGGPAPMRPPATWFDQPEWADGDVVTLTDPSSGRTLRGVPMHYDESGEVWGHLALWGQCHTGSAEGSCVLTPSSRLDYVPFHHGSIMVEDGRTFSVGNLSMGGGHADDLLSYAGTIEHYDEAGTLVAQVRAGEDEYGVWVHGAGMPDVWADEVAMRRLRACSPSGDWRPFSGGLELTAALAVNVPGFPVPRARVASGGQIVSLVAAGAREAAMLATAASGPAGARLAEIVQRAVTAGIEGYMVRQAEAAETAAKVGPSAELRRLQRDAARRRLLGVG